MITLKQAAEAFNKTLFTSVVDQFDTFYGQLLPFNDSVGSGVTSRRRVVEVAPDVVVPSGRVAESNGETYIFGSDNVDYYLGEIVRSKLPVVIPDGEYDLTTVSDILNLVPPDKLWAGIIKEGKFRDEQESVNRLNIFIAFFPNVNTVSSDSYLILDSKYYRCLTSSYVDSAGFGAVEVVWIDSPLQVVEIVTYDNFDPVSETAAKTSYPNQTVFVEPADVAYINTRLDFEKVEAGDKIISSVLAVEAGDEIGNYRVIAVKQFATLCVSHCRRL